MADVTKILGDHNISIEAVVQKEPTEGIQQVPIIMLTRVVTERNMNNAIADVEALGSIHGSITRIRVEHLGSE